MDEPLTTEQLTVAFEAFAWPGWTLEAAMADPIRSRLVKARACQIRTRAFQRTHARAYTTVKRFDPVRNAHYTQRAPVGWDDRTLQLDLQLPVQRLHPTSAACPK